MSVFHRVIPEQRIDGKRLGRHVHHDERSRAFEAEQADAVTSVVHAVGGASWLPLDQGQLGSCTANALVGARMLAPDAGGRGQFFEKDAVWLYGDEQVLQGQPRNADTGGTGVNVCKCAVAAKWISSYQHTFSLDAALKALVLRPVLLGCNWYEGFDTPDESGLVKISGQVRGGHEICGYGIDAPNQLVWFQNSWGASWGVGHDGVAGRFYMSFDTLGHLLSEQGDVTVPVR